MEKSKRIKLLNVLIPGTLRKQKSHDLSKEIFQKKNIGLGFKRLSPQLLIIKVLQVKLRERIKIYTDTHTQNPAKSILLSNDLI